MRSSPSQVLAVTFTEKAAGSLKSRLAGLGVRGRRSPHLPRLGPPAARHALAPVHRQGASRDPQRQGADPQSDRERAARRVSLPASPGACGRDRVGEEPTREPGRLPRGDRGRGPHAAAAPRSDAANVQGLRAHQGRPPHGLRGHAHDARAPARRRARGRRTSCTSGSTRSRSTSTRTSTRCNRPCSTGGSAARDELCVVGDDYQTIYTFTGASPEHLLTFPDRYPDATVVRLEDNYRSSPQVLTVANALARSMGGFEKRLRATRDDGPNPTARALSDADAEVAFVVAEARRLHDEGVGWEQIAVLYRINARSEAFEEAFAAAKVPYQVRDGSFLRRPGPRGAIARLRRADRVRRGGGHGGRRHRCDRLRSGRRRRRRRRRRGDPPGGPRLACERSRPSTPARRATRRACPASSPSSSTASPPNARAAVCSS